MPSYKYKKTSRSKSTSNSQKNTNNFSKSRNSKNTLTPKTPEKRKKDRNPESIVNQILPYVWGLLAFAVAFSCLFAQTLVAVAKIFAVAFLGFDGIVVCGLCLASGEIAFLVGAGVELLCGALVAAGGEA